MKQHYAFHCTFCGNMWLLSNFIAVYHVLRTLSVQFRNVACVHFHCYYDFLQTLLMHMNVSDEIIRDQQRKHLFLSNVCLLINNALGCAGEWSGLVAVVSFYKSHILTLYDRHQVSYYLCVQQGRFWFTLMIPRAGARVRSYDECEPAAHFRIKVPRKPEVPKFGISDLLGFIFMR